MNIHNIECHFPLCYVLHYLFLYRRFVDVNVLGISGICTALAILSVAHETKPTSMNTYTTQLSAYACGKRGGGGNNDYDVVNGNDELMVLVMIMLIIVVMMMVMMRCVI